MVIGGKFGIRHPVNPIVLQIINEAPKEILNHLIGYLGLPIGLRVV
jgi:hypothetical protein